MVVYDDAGFVPTDYDWVPVLACPLCCDTDSVLVANGDRYGLPNDVRRCKDCGLSYLGWRLTESSYERFYGSGDYRKLASAWHGHNVMDGIEEDQREYGERLAAFLLANGGSALPGLKMLDVGASTGIVAEEVASGLGYGYKDVVIIDTANEFMCGMFCRAKYVSSVPLRVGSVPLRVGLVIICRTLDHIVNPVETLKACARRLAPNGRLWVDVLDTDEEVATKGWLDTAKLDHPCYFTDSTARLAVKLAGLKVIATAEIADRHPGYLCERQA